MPMKAGSSQKTISSNIEELMHKFMGTGSIGTSTPPNPAAAQKQAAAIAYSKAGKSRKPRKPKAGPGSEY